MSNLLIWDVEESSPVAKHSVLARYFVAVLAACMAESVIYPLDVTKTRLQLQNEVAAVKQGLKMENRGLFSTAMNIAKNEGVSKLWTGLIPMYHRHFTYSGGRLVLYEYIRRLLSDESGNMSLGIAILCGAGCGSVAQFFASPADLVKVQMQGESYRILQGQPPRFNGCIQAYKRVYRDGGIRGYWRGVIPNVHRAALVNIDDLTAYDYSKRMLKQRFKIKDGILLHSLSAFIAGVIAAVLCTPADLIKTRLMNQPTARGGKGKLYKGSLDCFRQSVKNEGLFGLYKGFVPLWLRLGPWTVMNWIAFEYIMNVIGEKPF